MYPVSVNCVFILIVVSKNLFFSNKVDISQIRNVVILRKRLPWKYTSSMYPFNTGMSNLNQLICLSVEQFPECDPEKQINTVALGGHNDHGYCDCEYIQSVSRI